MSVVPVGLVQMTCSASKEENLTKAISKIREAAAKGAKIICHTAATGHDQNIKIFFGKIR